MENVVNQKEPKVVTDWDDEDENEGKQKAHLWKKGQSGNIKGRPKGQTLKEYVKDMLSKLDDEEKLEFLKGMPKEVIWKMAEGNPTEDKQLRITVPQPILGGVTQLSVEEQARLREATMKEIGTSTVE